MGMGNLQRLWRMELPVAWPIILTGIRVATLLIVGVAAVAALVGGPGLGEELYLRGIRRIGSPGALEALLGGTLAVLIVALLFDLFYQLVGRFTISKGL
jgi:osmoprotectant transport system permease protein